MVDVIRVNGRMVNRMVRVLIEIKREYKKMGLGLMVKKLNGMIEYFFYTFF
jgi:hypothetical protein